VAKLGMDEPVGCAQDRRQHVQLGYTEKVLQKRRYYL